MSSVNTQIDLHFSQLQRWCADQLALESVSLVPVAGDAGFRKYYRVATAQSSKIAVYAPPASEKNHEFVAIANRLGQHGLQVPEIFACDYERGFLLISDLGDRQLLPLLDSESADGYYRAAIDEIIKLQSIPAAAMPLDTYDAKELQREMDLLTEWFIPKLLGYALRDEEAAMIQALNTTLIAAAQAQPQVFVHRDYHSRNLMVTDTGLGLIDFQDGIWGPATYDVVSLLKDCYVKWPQETLDQCLAYYHQHMPFDEKPSLATLQKQFDWMGLQRHIKVLGIFARLSLRDNKHAYLHDLPRVIAYTLEAAEAYPETRVFADWFRRQLLPIIQQQAWYTAA